MTLSDRLLHPAAQRLQALPLPCEIQLPGGRRIGASAARAPALCLVIRDMRALLHLAQGAIGRLAEDYVEGRLEIEGRLRDLMAAAPALLGQDPTQARELAPRRWLQGLQRLVWERTHHSRRLDAEQVQRHYDVSDDFYALWLDPRRVYSCAYFAAPGMNLAQAQEAKLDHICTKLMLRPGERLIDIGAGWGGLLLWAAEHYGVDATGITLSRNQYDYVNALIARKGLQGRVRMLLQDYRDVDATRGFDKVASVGMCEHVGRPNLPRYFAKIRAMLRPGGLVLNHGITAGGTDNPQLGAGMGDFIEKYIFPGGQLVHVSTMLDALARGGLEPLDAENLRPHYAQTLWCWVDALEARMDEARRVLGDGADKVLRAYRLYLAGSAMGFEQGWLALFQILAQHPDTTAQASGKNASHLAATHGPYGFNRAYMYDAAGSVETARPEP